MKKIKFKTEYKPLSDAQIERHKNFDQLFTAYTAQPVAKTKLFHKGISGFNKLLFYMGGLFTGVAVSSLIWFYAMKEQPKQIAQDKTQNNTEQISSSSQTQSKIESDQEKQIKADAVVAVADSIIAGSQASEANAIISKSESANQESAGANTTIQNREVKSNDHSLAENKTGNSIASSESNVKTVSENSFEQKKENDGVKNSETEITNSTSQNQLAEISSDQNSSFVLNAPEEKNSKTITNVQSDLAVQKINEDILVQQTDSKKSNDKSSDQKKEPDATSSDKNVVHAKNDSALKLNFSFAPVRKFFARKLFDVKDSSRVGGDLIDRPAQVTFVTPLSSNGIDSYKFRNKFSFNVLEGYNGGLNGIEFGGIANVERREVKGGQFAGVLNFAGGDLSGVQVAGVANFSNAVFGSQLSGVMNVSASYVKGAQGAGVFNFALDSVNGTQLAGVMNIALGNGTSKNFQASGVLNFSWGKMIGSQVSSSLNVANRIEGAQIGILNVAKNIKGFQLGLVNISDSISGVAIGLLSVSANGRFDIDLWTSDVLQFNGGLRIGTKDVYNIYSFGISPFTNNNEQPLGFGIGLGTQQYLFKSKAFLATDLMSWGMTSNTYRFYKLDLLHQLRITGGYELWKYFSLYGGPTLNVQVADHNVSPLTSHPLYENLGTSTDVRMWIGFVAGVMMF